LGIVYFDLYQVSPETLDKLDEARLPAIIYWKGFHIVVLYGKRGQYYIVSDPGIGVRHLTRQELLDGWQGGITLFLTPHPVRFHLVAADPAIPYGTIMRWLRSFRTELSWILLSGVALTGGGIKGL
jgi:ATP-binding cassette subfamily C protein